MVTRGLMVGFYYFRVADSESDISFWPGHQDFEKNDLKVAKIRIFDPLGGPTFPIWGVPEFF